MIVWILIIMTVSGGWADSGVSVVVVDNIATAQSCEQLAKVIRNGPKPAGIGASVTATCTPVRKAKI